MKEKPAVQHQKTGPEAALAAAWAALAPDALLVTREGERVRVRFPGLPNSGPGPDFRRALLATERGRLVRGDVELHTHGRGWREHGHDTDPGYDRVVLHVVVEAEGAAVTQLRNGARVPLAELEPAPAAQTADHPCIRCRGAGLDEAALLPRLEQLGRQRLATKAAAAVRIIARLGPDQALYVALLSSLGGPQNRDPWLRLAQGLPWEEFQNAGLWLPPEISVLRLQALLLGCAGLLEDDARTALPPAVRARLLPHWHALARPALLPRAAWRTWGCRPSAQPWLRLVGAATLLYRCLAPGPWALLPDTFILEDTRATIAALRKGFTVSGSEVGLGQSQALIGPGRADALAVNVALPFLVARHAGDTEIIVRLENLVRKYPGLEADTVVRGLSRALGLAGRLGSCQQQGLHQLWRRYCQRGRQGRCPITAVAR